LWVIILTLDILFVYREYISKDAEGAGFSEIKAILAGVDMPNFLAMRTGVSKFIGVACAVIGGLSVGKSAPYCHISAILVH
jgi:H+/Cl- antiporter ClcA